MPRPVSLTSFPQRVSNASELELLRKLEKSEAAGQSPPKPDAWAARAPQVARALVIDVVEDAGGKPLEIDGHTAFLVRNYGDGVGRPVFDEKLIATLIDHDASHTTEATEALAGVAARQNVGSFGTWGIQNEAAFGATQLLRRGETEPLEGTDLVVSVTDVRRKGHFLTRPTYHQTLTVEVPVAQAERARPSVTLVGFNHHTVSEPVSLKWKREGDVLRGTYSFSNEVGPRDRVFRIDLDDGQSKQVQLVV